MATFNYVGIDTAGKEKKGSVDAEDKTRALAVVKQMGLIPTDITEQNFLNKDINVSLSKKAKSRDLSLFCRQCASLLHAGVTVVDALNMLSDATENKGFAAAIRGCAITIQKGETLGVAMRDYPEYFDSTMVWYSSEGKRLKSIFERLNERLDAEAKSMGVGMSETELYASYTSDGDTANVWNGDRIVWLSRFQPDNVKTITLPADSTFLPGDIFKLSFDPHFLSPTGLHSVYVLFCAYYEDNTVASQVRMVSGGNYRTEIDILPNLYQNTLQPQRLAITLYTPPLTAGSRDDLFYLTHPVLLRIHTRKPDEKPAETDAEALPVDSISSDSLSTDTLRLPSEPVRRLTPQEERDQREERHDIEIVKERIVRPARPARVRRSL